MRLRIVPRLMHNLYTPIAHVYIIYASVWTHLPSYNRAYTCMHGKMHGNYIAMHADVR